MIEENERIGALLKYELDKNYSRDVVTIAAGQNLTLGSVLGTVTADGTYKIVSIASPETDGSDTAKGILLQDVDATDADTKALILSRGAIVSEKALVFPTGTSEDQKKAFKASLNALGIVVRSVIA